MAKFYRSMGADLSKVDSTVLGWLRELDDTYSILVEFAVGKVNCDFAILGQASIAAIEVKNYREAIKGTANSHWTLSRSGRRLPAASVTGYAANPVGQAKKVGDTFAGFLRKHFREIFAGGSVPEEYQLKAFPFVVIPRPHADNQLVKNDDFCWVAQGKADFLAQFKTKRWPELRLNSRHQVRIVELLDLVEVPNPARLYAPLDFASTPLYEEEVELSALDPAPERTLPEAWLKLEASAGQPEVEFALTERVTSLGRSPESDIQLDLELASRKHCQVEYLGGEFFLQDLSTHGTYLDGQRLVKGSLSPLKDRAVIEITSGGLRFIFRQAKDPV